MLLTRNPHKALGRQFIQQVVSSQAVASKLHGVEVEVEIIKTKEENDHVQFLITETSSTSREQYQQAVEIETLSLGKAYKILIFSIYRLVLIQLFISRAKNQPLHFLQGVSISFNVR